MSVVYAELLSASMAYQADKIEELSNCILPTENLLASFGKIKLTKAKIAQLNFRELRCCRNHLRLQHCGISKVVRGETPLQGKTTTYVAGEEMRLMRDIGEGR